MRFFLLLLALAGFLSLLSCISPMKTSKNHAKKMHSMVVCSHPAAAKAGKDISLQAVMLMMPLSQHSLYLQWYIQSR
jgi:hypothetical protein